MSVRLRSHVEALLVERDLRLDEYKQALSARLEKLNDLRQEVTEDRASYLRVERFEAEIRALDDKILASAKAMSDAKSLSDSSIDQRLGRLESWQSKAVGAAVVLTLFAGAAGAAILRVLSGS